MFDKIAFAVAAVSVFLFMVFGLIVPTVVGKATIANDIPEGATHVVVDACNEAIYTSNFTELSDGRIRLNNTFREPRYLLWDFTWRKICGYKIFSKGTYTIEEVN